MSILCDLPVLCRLTAMSPKISLRSMPFPRRNDESAAEPLGTRTTCELRSRTDGFPDSAWDLATGHHAAASAVGIALTAVAVAVMPLLGWAKHRLGRRLSSAATAGEGTQNYLCAAQAAAVLGGLAVTAGRPGGWWADPVIGLGIAAAVAWEGLQHWRGDDCC